MFSSGALLFWSEAEKCYRSPTFRIKLIFLALAGLNARPGQSLSLSGLRGPGLPEFPRLPGPPGLRGFPGLPGLTACP